MEREKTSEWLENKKAELSAINGLDPVEELLTQLGVLQASHDLLIEQLKRAYEHRNARENSEAAS
jgi:hypothetical protein